MVCVAVRAHLAVKCATCAADAAEARIRRSEELATMLRLSERLLATGDRLGCPFFVCFQNSFLVTFVQRASFDSLFASQ